MSSVQAMSAQLIWSCQGPSQTDCFMASTASSILMVSPTRKPPVSKAIFQVRPKSLRLIEVRASKEITSRSMGSFPRPASSVSSTTSRVTLDIQEIGGLQVSVAILHPRIQAGRIDLHFHRRAGWIGLVQDDGAAHALEVPLDCRKHHVLAGELDQRMRGVELPDTTGWNSRFTLRCHVIPSITKNSFRCCWLRERLSFSFPLPSYFLSGCAGRCAALTHTHGVAHSATTTTCRRLTCGKCLDTVCSHADHASVQDISVLRYVLLKGRVYRRHLRCFLARS